MRCARSIAAKTDGETEFRRGCLHRGVPDAKARRRRGAQLDGLQLLPEIPPIEDVGALNAVQEAIRSVARPEELRRFYAADER